MHYLPLLALLCGAAAGQAFRGQRNQLSMHTFQNTIDRSHAAQGKRNATVSPRIFGGSYAPEGVFPYMVFFLYSPSQDFNQQVFSCSAAAVGSDKVLLAAHCFDGQPPVELGVIVVAGRADLSLYITERFATAFSAPVDSVKFGVEERRVANIKIHPKYNIKDKTHDVALLLLTTPFMHVQILQVARAPMKSRMSCTIIGWGLSEGNQRTYKLLYASDVYARTVSEGCMYKDSGNFICLEKSNKGICQGDSGSPLVCGGLIYGVASHLVSYEDRPDCGDDFEEYYEEIYEDLTWFDEVTSGQSQVFAPPGEGGGGSAGMHQPCSLLLLTAALATTILRTDPK